MTQRQFLDRENWGLVNIRPVCSVTFISDREHKLFKELWTFEAKIVIIITIKLNEDWMQSQAFLYQGYFLIACCRYKIFFSVLQWL